MNNLMIAIIFSLYFIPTSYGETLHRIQINNKDTVLTRFDDIKYAKKGLKLVSNLIDPKNQTKVNFETNQQGELDFASLEDHIIKQYLHDNRATYVLAGLGIFFVGIKCGQWYSQAGSWLNDFHVYKE